MGAVQMGNRKGNAAEEWVRPIYVLTDRGVYADDYVLRGEEKKCFEIDSQKRFKLGHWTKHKTLWFKDQRYYSVEYCKPDNGTGSDWFLTWRKTEDGTLNNKVLLNNIQMIKFNGGKKKQLSIKYVQD